MILWNILFVISVCVLKRKYSLATSALRYNWLNVNKLFKCNFDSSAHYLYETIIARCVPYINVDVRRHLAHQDRDKLVVISQVTIFSAFLSMKIVISQLKINGNVFPFVQLKISQHRFIHLLGNKRQAIIWTKYEFWRHLASRSWLIWASWCIYASIDILVQLTGFHLFNTSLLGLP